MRSLSAIAFIATIVGLPLAANAADLGGRIDRYEGGLKDEPYMPFSWSGFYLGGHIGGGWGDANVVIPAYPSRFEENNSGVVGGGHAGYNFQIRNFVFGVEGDFSGADVSGTHLSGLGSELYKIDENWRASVRGRFGVAFGHALVYGTAGGGWVNVDTQYAPLAGGVHGGTLSGYTVGGGLEYALSPNWSIRGEYLYGDYDAKRFVHNGPSNVDYTTQEVRAGVSYKFGNNYEPLK